MTQTIVVDTSAILSIFEERVSLEGQLRELVGETSIVVPSAVREELSAIDSVESRSAAALASKYGTWSCMERGDEGVIEAAVKMNAFAVVTNDSILAGRLVRMGIRVIRMKGRKKFGFYKSDEVQ